MPDAVGYIAGAARGTGLDAISVVARARNHRNRLASSSGWMLSDCLSFLFLWVPGDLIAWVGMGLGISWENGNRTGFPPACTRLGSAVLEQGLASAVSSLRESLHHFVRPIPRITRLPAGRQQTDGAVRILLKDELDWPRLRVKDVGFLPDQPVCRPEQIMENQGAVRQGDRALTNLALPGNTVSTDISRKFGFGARSIGRETQLEEPSDLAASPCPVASPRIDNKFI